MQKNHRGCLVAVVLLLAVTAWADDWPTCAHDYCRSGVTAERVGPPLVLRWVFRSPAPPAQGWARPVNGYGATKNKSNASYDDAPRVVAVGDTVYFNATAENKVYAIDAQRGRVRWSFTAGGPPRVAPTIHEGKVYIGADDGVAYCLDADDGRVVWKHRAAPTSQRMLGTGRLISLWPLRTGVLVTGKVAFFTAGLFPSEGVYLTAVDADSGELRWRRALHLEDGDRASPQGPLLISDDSIYLTSRVAPVRRSLEDGRPIPFQTPISNHEHRFHNGGSYAQLWGETIVYGQAAILGYNANETWTDKYGRQQRGVQKFFWFGARRAVLGGKTAYLATDDHLLAVPSELLTELSKNECHEFEQAYKKHRVASYLTALEAAAEHGKESALGKRLKETSLKWGRDDFERWPAVAEGLYEEFAKKCAWMTPIRVTESMILSGDVLYAGGETEVVAVDAQSGKVLWRDTTDCRVRDLAASNGRLLVSTIDGNVRCYEAMTDATDSEQPTDILPSPQLPPKLDARRTAFYATMAKKILGAAGTAKGYALIVGAEDSGRLAYELATASKLHVVVVDADAVRVTQARAALSAAGLYGSRVTVERMLPGKLPFPPYVFNVVVDPHSFVATEPPLEELFRVTKPCGGLLWMGEIGGGSRTVDALGEDTVPDRVRALESKGATLRQRYTWFEIVRSRVPHSADWTHNYGTAANTYCNEDPLVKGPFGILWYGGPGPRRRIDRHSAGPVPLVVGSRAFLLGYDEVMAYDIYNGVPLWQRTIIGATRTGLPLGTSNLAADASSLFIVINDRECLRLNAATGETIQTYHAPVQANGERGYWGWIATVDGVLLGSRAKIDQRRKRADPRRADAVFALDADTGKQLWTHDGADIDQDGTAVAQRRVLLVDRVLDDSERKQAKKNLPADKAYEDRRSVDRRGDPIEPDLRKLVSLDLRSGSVVWQKPLDLSDVTLDDTIVSDSRVGVACMVRSGVVVVHGTGSLGHPYQEFLKGEFQRRAIYAFDLADGKLLWGGRKNHRKRPIIVGDHIYAEPHAWHMRTGELKTYVHPVSGKAEPLDFFRGYIGCSHLLGSANALFGNQQGIGYLNLDQTCGYGSFGNIALACGLGAVPAGGVFVAPEGRSGCTCDTPIHTSIGLYPRSDHHGFSRGIPGGVSAPVVTPVRRMAINLGAPGFRQDDRQTLWVPYPARDAAGLLGDWLPKYGHDRSMFYRHSVDWMPIEGTETPWVYASGYAHTKQLRFRLIEPEGPAAQYTVRLHFAEPETIAPGHRVFDVLLQGRPVLKGFDMAAESGGPRRALIKEFRDVSVDSDLVVELKPTEASPLNEPILCGLEAVRE